MRQIKFRAWDTIRSQWLEDGNYNDLMIDMSGGLYRVQQDSCETPARDLDNYILMQFTGLKDKNGTEIYESDILLLGTEKTVIKFHQSAFCICEINGNEFYPLIDIKVEETDVIGNIYSNPDLLS